MALRANGGAILVGAEGVYACALFLLRFAAYFRNSWSVDSVMRVLLLRVVLWVCMVTVLVLALMPTVPHMPSTGWDKSNHLLAFTVLTLLGQWAYPRSTMTVLSGLIAYGALIEGLQSLTPDRYAEWADLLADCCGLLLGRWLYTALIQKNRKTT